MNYRPFTINDAVRGVVRRRKSVVAFFMATCLLIGTATFLTPKKYKSESRLFMRLGRENTSLDATTTLGEHPVVMLPQSREAEINSIVELVQAKQLYEQVVDQIGPERILDPDWKPDEDGSSKAPSLIGSVVGSIMNTCVQIGLLNDLPQREKAIIKLQKNVEIEAFEKSNVLTISFVSHTPELAQEVVDKLVQSYQTQHVNLHRPPRAYEFLENETHRIERELSVARVNLEDFKNETGILESTQQRTVLIDQIAKLKADLLEAEATKVALQTEVEELSEGLSHMEATTTMSETVGAGNEGADGMRQELFRLEVLRERNAAKYTEAHPNIIQIDKQLRQVKELLAKEESARKESIIGPNRIYQETAVALEQKKPMLAAAHARIVKLQEQLHGLNVALQTFTSDERKFAELDRNVEIMEANYRKYFANLEQARIDTKMKSEEFSNIGIAQPATLNLKPHSPNKLLNLAAAIILGTFGGIGLGVIAEYINPSLSTTDDIEATTGLPVIANVPELSTEQLRFGSKKGAAAVNAAVAAGVRPKRSGESMSMLAEQI